MGVSLHEVLLKMRNNRGFSLRSKPARIGWLVIFAVLCLCLYSHGWSAESVVSQSAARGNSGVAGTGLAVPDPLGRSTPQGTVLGFMKSAKQEDYERALQYLDTRRTGRGGERLVRDLQAVLDHGFKGKPAMLSSKTEGSLTDNLPPSKEWVGTVETPSGSVEILLERMQKGNDPPVWLFSSETLAKVPGIPKRVSRGSIEEHLPDFLVYTWFLWFPLWRWVTIILLIPLSFAVATLITRLLVLLSVPAMRRLARVQTDQHLIRLTGPVRILIFALAIWSISFFSSSIVTSLFWNYVASTLAVIGVTWLSIRLIDIVLKLKQRQLAGTTSGKVSIIQLTRKMLKILAVIIGALTICYIAGINISAALTGLGIGGLAIAFAAQKTLENLFGGIMIISDQPIHVGDFCKVGAYSGTVEEIGLRSTYIRTIGRTLVSIPNGQLAVMNIENVSRRDKILFNHTVGLRYETTSDQLRYVVDEIRRMIFEDAKMESATARVRVVKFADSSINIEVFAYVLEKEYEVFLEIQERLLLKIMEIVEAGGTGMAFPSRTIYVEHPTIRTVGGEGKEKFPAEKNDKKA
jgi:MscS family membrane protein